MSPPSPGCVLPPKRLPAPVMDGGHQHHIRKRYAVDRELLISWERYGVIRSRNYMNLERPRGDQFVNNRGDRTHSFNLSYGHHPVDLKSCSNDRFFLRSGPAKRTGDLPPNGFRNANLAIERWQESEGIGAEFDLGTNATAVRMTVRLVGHESGRKCQNIRLLPLAEQRAINFDILPGVLVVAVLLDELTDVANPFAEISI